MAGGMGNLSSPSNNGGTAVSEWHGRRASRASGERKRRRFCCWWGRPQVCNSNALLTALVLAVVYFALAGPALAQTYSLVGGWPSGPGAVPLNAPLGVATDAWRNVYVADGWHTIIKLDSAGNVLASWGGLGSGNGQFAGPGDVAVDGAGNVYVADAGNCRIQKFSSTGTYLMQWGTYGTGNGQFGRYNNSLAPGSVTVDQSGNVYVADTENHRIQKFSSSGTYVTQWSDGPSWNPYRVVAEASGNVLVADTENCRIQRFTPTGTLLTQWGSSGSGDGEFWHPYGVAVDAAGNVYVSDQGNNRVQKFTPEGIYLAQWGTYGTGNGQLSQPNGIAVDNLGTVYVANTENTRIERFASTGTSLTSWGNLGSSAGTFYEPLGIAVDAAGDVYVADAGNDRIQRFTSTGAYVTQWGGRGGANGQLWDPDGVAVDNLGNVYVADGSNGRIQKFTSAGVYLNKWVGWYLDGYDPLAIALDASGNVYVIDYTYSQSLDHIQKFKPDGTYLSQWGTHGTGDGSFSYCYGVAVDASGNVIVADTGNNRIQKFTATGTYVSKWGQFGSGNGQFDSPSDVAVDASGSIYVVDQYNNRIQKFTSGGTYLTQWGGDGIGAGQFRRPSRVAVSRTGIVYVADSLNNRVQVFAVNLPAPAISAPNGGANCATNNPAAVLTGTCDSSAPAIHVNGSAAGVSHTWGETTWSYTGAALASGANAFSVTAYNGVAESAAAELTITLDTTPPTVSMSSTAPQSARVSPIPVAVAFSKAVAGFTADDITPGNATVSNFAGSGSAYSFDLVPNGQGTVTADIAAGIAQDAATNGNTAATRFSRTYDSVAPGVAVSGPSSALTASGPVTFTVSYSGADGVTLATGDVSLNKTGTADAVVGVSGTGTSSRTVTLSGVTGDGTVSLGIAANTASDTAGNSAAASGPSATLTVDNTPPVITLRGSNPVEIGLGSAYVDSGATAWDAVDGVLDGHIVVDSSAVDTSAVGAYSVTYTLADTAGNVAIPLTRTVNVMAEAAPLPLPFWPVAIVLVAMALYYLRSRKRQV